MFATTATGGAGSYPSDLLNTLTRGLNIAIDGAASKYLSKPAPAENVTVNANNQAVPSGAPGKKDTLTDTLQNPYVIGGALLLLTGGLVYSIMRRRR